MILTYKIKHKNNFSKELEIAKDVSRFAISNRDKLSSKYVKHFGLKSTIANQILRKYGRNKKCKIIKSVKLTIPNQSIKLDQENKSIYIPCLKLNLNYKFSNNFLKINQIEIDKTYCFVTCEFEDTPLKNYKNDLGVDLNTTGHCVVAAIPTTGKVFKFGKKAQHIRNKYKNTRKKLQKKGKYNKLKKLKKREKRIIKNLNHVASKKIVDIAEKNKCNIKLENLEGIRKNNKIKKSFKYFLNSWSFYQFRQYIEYKAKKKGIKVSYVAPQYTSQMCSRCGLLGKRDKKSFECVNCKHVDNADCNAAFNIAKQSIMHYRSAQDRDCVDGSTDTPKMAMTLDAGQP